MTIFETERLIVRQYNFDMDKENFFRMNSNEEIMRYIRPVKTREECDVFLNEIIVHSCENPGIGRWAAIEKQSGDFVGSFAIIPVEGTDDFQLGYSLLTGNWGKGFASELTLGGMNYFFSTTSFDKIYGITEVPNIASQKVLIKAGFQPSGGKKEGERELLVFKAGRDR
jgi:[ribosomal protein S5]-alanine N-acetyltransferase